MRDVSTYMSERLGWDCGHKEYACADGTKVVCDFGTRAETPMNGLWLRRRLEVLISGVQTSRAMRKVVKGHEARMCTFPRTITVIGECSFRSMLRLLSVRCEGLRVLEESAFESSGLRSFTAPPSLGEVGSRAFASCRALRRVDFSACALQSSGESVFRDSAVESVFLPRTLRVIGERAF